jgi:hypothetical protein
MVDFRDFYLPLPETVHTLPEEEQILIFEYLFQLDELNMKAYSIAYKHLGSSFNIIKSNGFIQWNKKREKKG